MPTKIRVNQLDVDEILNSPDFAASDTNPGIVEIATQVEVNAGTDTARVVTPSTLSNAYEPIDATILKDADIGVSVQAFDANILVAGDIGVTVAANGHNHDTIYEPIDGTILRDADINDAGTLVTELFSANKINSELALKSDTTHNHNADYVAITGDTMTGNLTVAVDSLPQIDIISPTGNVGVRTVIDGANQIVTQVVDGTGTYLSAISKIDNPATQIEYSIPVLAQYSQPADVNALTRKDYVDDTTVSITGDTMTGNLSIKSTAPRYFWYEDDQALDEKRWDILATGGALTFRAITDNGITASVYLTVSRTAGVVDNVTFPKPIIATGGVDALTTASGIVNVAAATAPTVGQVLKATSATVATWQTLLAGDLINDGTYVSAIGDTTMGGNLTILKFDPTIILSDNISGLSCQLQNASGQLRIAGDAGQTIVYSGHGLADNAGHDFKGPVLGNTAPTLVNHLTRKDYVDTAVGTKIGNVLEDATPQLGGTLDCVNRDIDNARTITFDSELAVVTTAVNWTLGQKLAFTVTAAITPVFTSPTGPCNLTLKVINGGTGVITWPATVKWSGGTEPTWTTTGTDICSFYYDGTNYYGMAGLAFA